jgi:hypothetical protein
VGHIRELHHDDVDAAGKLGMLHQASAEIGVVPAAMVLAQSDHVGAGPRRKDAFD